MVNRESLRDLCLIPNLVNLTLEGPQTIIVQTGSELVDWWLGHSTLLSRIQGCVYLLPPRQSFGILSFASREPRTGCSIQSGVCVVYSPWWLGSAWASSLGPLVPSCLALIPTSIPRDTQPNTMAGNVFPIFGLDST